MDNSKGGLIFEFAPEMSDDHRAGIIHGVLYELAKNTPEGRDWSYCRHMWAGDLVA